MRLTLILIRAFVMAGAAYVSGDDIVVVHKDAGQSNAPALVVEEANAAASPGIHVIEKAGAAAEAVPVDKSTPAELATAERSVDEEAVRQAAVSFATAYEQGDAKAVAAHFTTDAEYVDESGNVVQGRDAIEQSLTEFFVENPDCKLEMNIETIRFISSGVAVEDGSTKMTSSEQSHSVDSRYTTVHVKTDGKWLAASVRDHVPVGRREHRAQLQQLDWLLGDWVDEGDDSIVHFACESVDHGNFLLRKFTILIAGQEAMSGTQRIGWDPLTGKLRAWIFDSEGGYGEGLWHRDGDRWVLKCHGVTADNETASSTSIYTFINGHTMTWQSVDHEIAGVQQPDSEVFTIVRQSPVPAPVIAVDEN